MKKVFLIAIMLLGLNIGKAGRPPAPGPKIIDGKPKTGTPIDTNKAVLIITASLIAGVMGYRKTSLRKV